MQQEWDDAKHAAQGPPTRAARRRTAMHEMMKPRIYPELITVSWYFSETAVKPLQLLGLHPPEGESRLIDVSRGTKALRKFLPLTDSFTGD